MLFHSIVCRAPREEVSALLPWIGAIDTLPSHCWRESFLNA